MTNKYLEKLADNSTTSDTNKTFLKSWGAGIVGAVAGTAIGGKLGGSRLARLASIKARKSDIGRSISKGIRGIDRKMSDSKAYKFFRPKNIARTSGAAAGAFVGSHLGADAADYAVLHHSIGNIKDREKMNKQAFILKRIAQNLEEQGK